MKVNLRSTEISERLKEREIDEGQRKEKMTYLLASEALTNHTGFFVDPNLGACRHVADTPSNLSRNLSCQGASVHSV